MERRESDYATDGDERDSLVKTKTKENEKVNDLRSKVVRRQKKQTKDSEEN